MSDKRNPNPRTKQSQRRKIGPTFGGPREARIHSQQLGFVFTVNVNAGQASDADMHSQTAQTVSRTYVKKETYIYNYLRWAGR